VTTAAVATMEDRFLAVLVTLQPGEVVSYADVADVAGYPGRSRAVGRLLATTAAEVPWWRVVRSDGRLATTPPTEQAGLLRAEGVVVRGGRVVEAPAGRFRPSR
jgi:methylated-DNA-protein-cysteine methyltransferase-like protein